MDIAICTVIFSLYDVVIAVPPAVTCRHHSLHHTVRDNTLCASFCITSLFNQDLFCGTCTSHMQWIRLAVKTDVNVCHNYKHSLIAPLLTGRWAGKMIDNVQQCRTMMDASVTGTRHAASLP